MPPKNLSDKAIKTSLSLPESLLEKSKEQAVLSFGGNFSRFIQSLIEQELERQKKRMPSPEDPEALSALFQQFFPSAKNGSIHWCERHQVKQNMFISKLLVKLNELQEADISPENILAKMELQDDEIIHLKVADTKKKYERRNTSKS